MIIGDHRLDVIHNIELAANNRDFTAKTEIGDPQMSMEERVKLVEDFWAKQDKFKTKAEGLAGNLILQALTQKFFGKIQVTGLDKLQHSQQELVIANHPTLIDVVVLIGLMEQANCVVKQALWSNPFTKGPVQSAGYILNAGSEQFIQDCVHKLQQDHAASLLIFPEGTRTAKGEQLNDFQRGAANIALRAGVPIRPVLISCTPSTLTKNEKWYHIPEQPFHIHVKVLDAIRVEDVLDDVTVNPKNVRQLNQQLQWFFNQELSVNEQSC